MLDQDLSATRRTYAYSAPPLPEGRIPIALYGLGAIGLATARAAMARQGLEIVGAVDVDPAKIGQDLGTLLGEEAWGLSVTNDLEALEKAKVVVHTTGSFLSDVAPQLEGLLARGLYVVSSTEELSFPYLKSPELAKTLDKLARNQNVGIVGVGINPGFAMDALPLILSAPCLEVRAVHVRRSVDTSRRRLNLQKKSGAGMTPQEFSDALAGGRMGHIGLAESAALLAHGLGWTLDSLEEAIAPVIAKRAMSSEYLTVPEGMVAGLHQIVRGFRNQETLVELELAMSLGEVEDIDETRITGTPNLILTVPGGFPGDTATVAMLLNAIPRILDTRPGLRTILDLPLPRLC